MMACLRPQAVVEEVVPVLESRIAMKDAYAETEGRYMKWAMLKNTRAD